MEMIENAAIAAMQSLLLTAKCDPDDAANEALEYATALHDRLKRKKQEDASADPSDEAPVIELKSGDTCYYPRLSRNQFFPQVDKWRGDASQEMRLKFKMIFLDEMQCLTACQKLNLAFSPY